MRAAMAGADIATASKRRAERQQRGTGVERRVAESFGALREQVEIEQQRHDAEHRDRADGYAGGEPAAGEELLHEQRSGDAALQGKQPGEADGGEREGAECRERRACDTRQGMKAEDEGDHEGGQQHEAAPVGAARNRGGPPWRHPRRRPCRRWPAPSLRC